MVEVPARRSRSEVLRRGYSDDELAHIFALGRFFLENAQRAQAEAIFQGLLEVLPDYVPALIGAAYLQICRQDIEGAASTLQQAQRLEPGSPAVILMLVACLLTLGDRNTAGSLLGEAGELIEAGAARDNADIRRFYKLQLARFEVGR